jgi:hypothetical protein
MSSPPSADSVRDVRRRAALPLIHSLTVAATAVRGCQASPVLRPIWRTY